MTSKTFEAEQSDDDELELEQRALHLVSAEKTASMNAKGNAKCHGLLLQTLAAVKKDWDWVETLDVTTDDVVEVPDANDDLNRELCRTHPGGKKKAITLRTLRSLPHLPNLCFSFILLSFFRPWQPWRRATRS